MTATTNTPNSKSPPSPETKQTAATNSFTPNSTSPPSPETKTDDGDGEALRDLADDFNARDPRKLYRLARQRDLDVTQAMAFEALKADVGRQVQAPRPRALGKSAAHQS